MYTQQDNERRDISWDTQLGVKLDTKSQRDDDHKK